MPPPHLLPILMPNGTVVRLHPPSSPASAQRPLLPLVTKRRGRVGIAAVGEKEEDDGVMAAGVLAVQFEREEMVDSEEEEKEEEEEEEEEQVAFEREVVESD